MSRGDDTYRALVSHAVSGRDRASSYVPEARSPLVIDSVTRPAAIDDLDGDDLVLLRALFRDRLEVHLADREKASERALVRDAATGELLHRLYTWNYGVLYLFDARLTSAGSVRLLAHATQHTVEVWSTAQRLLFFEMDAALRAVGHGLRQPLAFEWWKDHEWDEVIDAEPGTVGSQPWLRDLLGLAD